MTYEASLRTAQLPADEKVQGDHNDEWNDGYRSGVQRVQYEADEVVLGSRRTDWYTSDDLYQCSRIENFINYNSPPPKKNNYSEFYEFLKKNPILFIHCDTPLNRDLQLCNTIYKVNSYREV